MRAYRSCDKFDTVSGECTAGSGAVAFHGGETQFTIGARYYESPAAVFMRSDLSTIRLCPSMCYRTRAHCHADRAKLLECRDNTCIY